MNFLMVREVLKKHSRLDLQLWGHGSRHFPSHFYSQTCLLTGLVLTNQVAGDLFKKWPSYL